MNGVENTINTLNQIYLMMRTIDIHVSQGHSINVHGLVHN